MKNCFEHIVEWFDSPYYHILYKHRDAKEAVFFIDNLIKILKPPASAKMIDTGCGRGRHAIYLNRKFAFETVGIDLSPNNISFAKKFENPNLCFIHHDMRIPYKRNYFDIALNLFTSTGFFDCPGDNFSVFNSVNRMLIKGGVFVLDFFNSIRKVRNLVKSEKKVIDGIRFEIERKHTGNSIVKKISFQDTNGVCQSYIEKVEIFSPDDLKQGLESTGFRIKSIFGDYSLMPFHEDSSERFILISEKIADL